jgi:pimeloyl-ACP methyl ester carboxylesterase
MADADEVSAAPVEPRRRSVQCVSPKGLHRVAYLEWGDPRNRDVLLCVHGLTRSAHDFDALARALCGHYRVVCPDLAGRGDSDRLADPMLYAVPQYAADMVTLIARLDVESVDWVGTSLGGIVGMALAALGSSPVRRLVLNDSGPVISHASLERIATYVGLTPTFATFDDAVTYVRTISAPFGPHSEEQWRFLAGNWVRQGKDGAWHPHYDPRISLPFRANMPEGDMIFWDVWDAIRCPTLVLRGAQSDLLAKSTIQEMARRGPKAKTVEIQGVGHAPSLLHEDQIELIRSFLLEGAAT